MQYVIEIRMDEGPVPGYLAHAGDEVVLRLERARKHATPADAICHLADVAPARGLTVPAVDDFREWFEMGPGVRARVVGIEGPS